MLPLYIFATKKLADYVSFSWVPASKFFRSSRLQIVAPLELRRSAGCPCTSQRYQAFVYIPRRENYRTRPVYNFCCLYLPRISITRPSISWHNTAPYQQKAMNLAHFQVCTEKHCCRFITPHFTMLFPSHRNTHTSQGVPEWSNPAQAIIKEASRLEALSCKSCVCEAMIHCV